METRVTWRGAAAGCLVGILAFAAIADDPVISQVVVRQRWPWSRLVDIDYVLTCDATQSVDVALAASDGSTALPLPPESLAGDLYGVSHGLRRIVWDPMSTAYTNNHLLTQFSVALAPTPPPQYMVIDLSEGGTASAYPVTYHATAEEVPGGVTNDVYKTDKLILRRIRTKSGSPANGVFMMGSPLDETGRLAARETQKQAWLTKDYYIGVYEVTQWQWQKVMNARPSSWNNADYWMTRPVEEASYYDIRGSVVQGGAGWPTNNSVYADSFMGRIRAKTGLADFDLPTEAQWEYACRAGAGGALNDGTANLTNETSDARLELLGRYAWNGGKINGTTVPLQGCDTANATSKVGSYAPNAWGLYDMHGNVWEWCLDWYADLLLGGGDPSGAATGSQRSKRGGSWFDPASQCRSAFRSRYSPGTREPYNGFRLARTLP